MINFKGLQQNTTCMARISAAGIEVQYMNNVLTVSNEAAAQAIIDAFTLADAYTPRIVQVKELAKEKILAFLPEWKQSNYNARMNELNRIRADRGWRQDELDEVNALQAIWDQAKAIRVASDNHENNLRAAATFAAIDSYDINSNWP